MQPATNERDYVNQVRPNAVGREVDKLVNAHLTVTLFTTTKQSDLDQDWFHVHTTRQEAETALQDATSGSFLIRPSSQRGAYALSWKDDNNTVKFVFCVPDLHNVAKESGSFVLFPPFRFCFVLFCFPFPTVPASLVHCMCIGGFFLIKKKILHWMAVVCAKKSLSPKNFLVPQA